MLAETAHDIRTPLAAIGMAAANIARKSRQADLRDHLVTIGKKVKECDRIVSRLLARVRPDEGTEKMRPSSRPAGRPR